MNTIVFNTETKDTVSDYNFNTKREVNLYINDKFHKVITIVDKNSLYDCEYYVDGESHIAVSIGEQTTTGNVYVETQPLQQRKKYVEW
ncbi:hypothetical protein [Shewanella sp.]|uniref:hypothetical protein n=1 Tax=Shewanella sp. TaxID=50422 RepID=UPI00404839D9